MEAIVRQVRDFEVDERRVLEHILGQQLEENQQIIIQVTKQPIWLAKLVQGIHDLTALSPNWNSYGAKPVEPVLAAKVEKLLLRLVHPDTPQPAVVPTARGGLQIEWHTRGIDLEINFLSPDRLRVSYEDLRDGTEWEQELSFADFGPLIEAVRALSARK